MTAAEAPDPLGADVLSDLALDCFVRWCQMNAASSTGITHDVAVCRRVLRAYAEHTVPGAEATP